MRYTHADPTANTAIANVDRELRREARRLERERLRLEKAQAMRQEKGHDASGAAVWRLSWTDKLGRIR